MSDSLNFHLIWFAAMFVTVLVFVKLDWFFDYGKAPIAKMVRQNGNVRVRPMDLSLWKPTNIGQPLYEGQVLATGEDSTAQIIFSTGHRIKLGQYSQLRISAERDKETGDVLVTLLRGSLTAEKVSDKEVTGQIQLKSGNETVKLDNKTALNLTQSLTAPSPAIEIDKNKEEEKEDADQGVFGITKGKIPPPSPREAPLILEPVNARFWTLKHLQTTRSTLTVRATLPASHKRTASWIPVIALGNEPKFEFSARNTHTAEFSTQDVVRYGQRTQWNGLSGYRLTLRGGFRQAGSGNRGKVLGPASGSVTVASLAGLPAGPLTVTLKSLTWGNPSPKLHQAIDFTPGPSHPRIFLADSKDIDKLGGYMAGAGSFTLDYQKLRPTSQLVQIRRGSRKIAYVQLPPNASSQTVRELRTKLGGNLAFQGLDSNLLYTPLDRPSKLNLRAMGKMDSLYLAKGNSLIRINGKLLQRHPAIVPFLKKNVDLFLRRRVKYFDADPR